MRKMQKKAARERKRNRKIYCQPQGEDLDAARLISILAATLRGQTIIVLPFVALLLISLEILMKISVYNAKLLFSSINSSASKNRKKKIFI